MLNMTTTRLRIHDQKLSMLLGSSTPARRLVFYIVRVTNQN